MTGTAPGGGRRTAAGAVARWRTAAVAAVVLGCGGCSSPSVDPSVSVDPIERLGRRAVQPARPTVGGAVGAQGAPVGERHAPARTPSVDPVASEHSATSVRTARPSRTPVLRAPVLADSATRLLDRIHGPQRPPRTPGAPPERHAPR
ncbi:hypothetical protein [Streptomyces sp. NPDC048057]|uniref:hypothetical protein n=1 Tax=Streptomyces sp. NPDC048057 TaxID=3155628 RepID=UPI00340CF8BC